MEHDYIKYSNIIIYFIKNTVATTALVCQHILVLPIILAHSSYIPYSICVVCVLKFEIEKNVPYIIHNNNATRVFSYII